MTATKAHLRKAEEDARLTALLGLPHDALLKPPDAALVLGLAGAGTLSQWRFHHRWALKWYLIGSAIRYKLGDLLAFRESRMIDGETGSPAGMQRPSGPERPRGKARRSA